MIPKCAHGKALTAAEGSRAGGFTSFDVPKGALKFAGAPFKEMNSVLLSSSFIQGVNFN